MLVSYSSSCSQAGASQTLQLLGHLSGQSLQISPSVFLIADPERQTQMFSTAPPDIAIRWLHSSQITSAWFLQELGFRRFSPLNDFSNLGFPVGDAFFLISQFSHLVLQLFVATAQLLKWRRHLDKHNDISELLMSCFYKNWVLIRDFSGKRRFCVTTIQQIYSLRAHLVKLAGELLVLLRQQDSLSFILLLVVNLKLLWLALTVKTI